MNPFPTRDEKEQAVVDSWDYTCVKYEMERALTEDVEKLVSATPVTVLYDVADAILFQIRKRDSQIRGKLITTARPFVLARYGLRDGRSEEAREDNIDKVAYLKKYFAFYYAVCHLSITGGQFLTLFRTMKNVKGRLGTQSYRASSIRCGSIITRMPE